LSTSLSNVGAITLFVEDLESSKSFYQDVFGASIIFEDESSAAFKFDNTIVNLLIASAASELIEPGAVASPDTGARVQFTIWVDEADAACAELETRGVKLLNGPMDREWGMRTATFADPGGHIWEIAQKLS
jgi:catechol 2,3-dioxygenase-like lactoylglutathione lyase family enzyme